MEREGQKERERGAHRRYRRDYVNKLICFRCRRLHLRLCACGRIHSALRAKHWNLLRRAVEHYDEGIVTKYAETAKVLEERGLVRIFGKPFRGKVKVFARQAGRELHISRTADEACETARKVIEGLTAKPGETLTEQLARHQRRNQQMLKELGDL